MNNIVYIGSSIISGVINKTVIASFKRLKMLKQSKIYYNKNNYNINL